MFAFLKKDPKKKLNKEYNQKLEEAMVAQRNGDIEGYGELTAQAQDIYKQIQALESSSS